MVRVIRSIDAHVGGAAVRLLVDGAPRPSGKTMPQKLDWMKRHADPLRRSVMREPRGHNNLVGVVMADPVTPGADAGLLCMDADSYIPFSGAAVIAAATIAIERDLIVRAVPRLTCDTPAGTVHAAARLQTVGDRHRVDSVVLTSVPSFVLMGGHTLKIGARELRVDIAFGGLLYAIVDTEAIGVPLAAPMLHELGRTAAQICSAASTDRGILSSGGLDGVIFTGPPDDPEAHLRNVTIAAGGAIDRSPSVTGTCAVMAVLDAMGLLDEASPFVHESLVGTLHRGRVVRRTQIDNLSGIIPEVEASAWITGEHSFYIDEDDPFREGFLL
jgi:proline racemase